MLTEVSTQELLRRADMSHERGAHKSWVSRICYAINLDEAAYYNALSTVAAEICFTRTPEAKAMIAIVFILRSLSRPACWSTASRWGEPGR